MPWDQTRWYTIIYSEVDRVYEENDKRLAKEETMNMLKESNSRTGQGEQLTGAQKGIIQPDSTSYTTSKNISQEARASRPTPRTSNENSEDQFKKPPLAESIERLSRQLDRKASTPKLAEYWKALLEISDRPRFAPTRKEFGMLKKLTKWLEQTSPELKTHDFLRFSVSNWDVLRRRLTWPDSGRQRLSQHPNIQEIFFVKEDIVYQREKIQAGEGKRVVYTNIQEVPKDHPRYKELVQIIMATGNVTLR